MIFREARLADIAQIQVVRNSVKENRLSDPALVSDKDVEEYISYRGKGWVCLLDDKVIGFAIVSVRDNNVWALFVQPGYEGRGIGKKIHDYMMGWYFEQTNLPAWLGTAPGTRAEQFYRNAGWEEVGKQSNGEIRFEMTSKDWNERQTS